MQCKGSLIKDMFTLYWLAFAAALKPHRVGPLFTRKDGDFDLEIRGGGGGHLDP